MLLPVIKLRLFYRSFMCNLRVILLFLHIMRYVKNKFFSLIVLFIVFSINAEGITTKSYFNKNENTVDVFSAGDKGQKKSELAQLEGVLHTSFRLTENTTDFFQSSEHPNTFLQRSGDERLFFSQQYFAYYTTRLLNQVEHYPRYIRYCSLLI